MTDSTTTYKVPRLLWESFEAVLLAQGKRYVKEMASTLKVSEKELLKRVFPTKDAIKVILHDTHTESLQCQAHILTNAAIAGLCRKPVQLGFEFCAFHSSSRPLIVPTEATQIVRKLQDHPDRPPLWLLANNTVVDGDARPRGIYDEESGKLQLFQLEA